MSSEVIVQSAEAKLYFVYDGECPICRMAADLYQLRQIIGRFETIDARLARDHPIVAEIAAAGLDLDEGMVLKYDGTLYHGAEAFRLMAALNEPKGWFNRVTKLLAASGRRSRFTYPVVKGMRNLLIALLGVGKIADDRHVEIDNTTPIFKPIFGASWVDLPPVMHKHYANRPYCDDVSVVEGQLDVMCKWFLRPALRLLGAVPPFSQNDVPVSVAFTSQKASAGFGFEREFHFDGRAPVKFYSRMFHRGGQEIMEVMRFGMCWHALYGWSDGQVTLAHKGYSWRFGQRNLMLPLTWLIGRGDAYERPIDENSFAMGVTLSHPFLGIVYSYAGTFEVTKEIT